MLSAGGGGGIYYGIKTGFNKAFVLDGAKRAQLIAEDPKSAELIRPLVVGKDVRKWHANYADRWLIVTNIGVPIKRYPAIFAHLSQWQAELKKRQDQGNHWWELRACAYYEEFDKPKIVTPDIGKSLRFAFDTLGSYATNTSYFIPTDDLFLLGVLNSQAVEDYYIENSAQIRGGYLRFFTQYVERIPIPRAGKTDHAAIAALVEQCVNVKVHEPQTAELEAEIDTRVARLYGLS